MQSKEIVAVIGAGLAGCMSAIYLAKAGYKVLLIEQKPQIMSVSSKIPIHLHSGGLYIKTDRTKPNGLDMTDAFHCLHDSINFMRAMRFAATERLTAFAVMTIDDEKHILPNGKTQLLDEATDLYRKELLQKLETSTSDQSNIAFIQEKKRISNIEIPSELVDKYKSLARALQYKKWQAMQEGFEILRDKYAEMVSYDTNNKVFGEVADYYRVYSQQELEVLKFIGQESGTRRDDPTLKDKTGWAVELARVTNHETVFGIVMSSELGLNMIRARAGIQIELEKLRDKIDLVLNTKVEDIKQTTTGIVLMLNTAGRVNEIRVLQAVNAAGHQGKDIDLKMGYQLEWSVDVKGVGIVMLDNEIFARTPEVYFTQAKGMAHVGRLNSKVAGVNFTSPYVEATYVTGGKQVVPKDQPVQLNQTLQDFLQTPITDTNLLNRTRACITGCARFMPPLQHSVSPLAYLPGSLAIIGGNLESRSSHEVYLSVDGYHSVNIIKGGGAVSAAMTLVNCVEKYSNEVYQRGVFHFPNGSNSQLLPKFVIEYDPGIEIRAREEAKQSKLPEEAGRSYKPM